MSRCVGVLSADDADCCGLKHEAKETMHHTRTGWVRRILLEGSGADPWVRQPVRNSAGRHMGRPIRVDAAQAAAKVYVTPAPGWLDAPLEYVTVCSSSAFPIE